MFYIGFCSGSEHFIIWLQSMIKSLYKIGGHVTKAQKKNTYYQLKYSKYEAVRLAGFLYRNPKSIRLRRKYLKIKAVLSIMNKLKEI